MQISVNQRKSLGLLRLQTEQIHLQELSPWFRWLVYQALLTLLLRALAKRVRTLQPYLEALALL